MCFLLLKQVPIVVKGNFSRNYSRPHFPLNLHFHLLMSEDQEQYKTKIRRKHEDDVCLQLYL